MTDRPDAVAGALLGRAVGDAVGLPYEGMSARRGVRLLGPPDRHRFLFGRGMVSDDTEHSVMVLQALCEEPTDADRFARAFARRLRWWLIAVPAGVGIATLKATLKLWVGFPASRSGVFSAGNGPAMRTGVLGAAIDDLGQLRAFVRAAPRVPHTDPKAEAAAFAVALAAWCARRDLAAEFFDRHRATAPDAPAEFADLLTRVESGIAAGQSVTDFAGGFDRRGVSGYIYRTVPVALFAWQRHPTDCRAAVAELVRCGGDTDTTAANGGAIVGAGVGPSRLPADWVAGIWEWPRSVAWMRRLADAVTGERAQAPPAVTPGVGLARNAVFLAAVVAHVARRALPPY